VRTRRKRNERPQNKMEEIHMCECRDMKNEKVCEWKTLLERYEPVDTSNISHTHDV
jgi:hypothetical protein